MLNAKECAKYELYFELQYDFALLNNYIFRIEDRALQSLM